MSENTDNGEKYGNRTRGPNFTKDEQTLLFICMEPYNNKFVECKKTDSVKHCDKQRAWSKITAMFNANTKGVPRSVENLQGCYRNSKSKLKKEHSAAKMMLKDPLKKEALINALDENGKNWDAVSSSINQPKEICKKGFEHLEKEMKKEETKKKASMMKTGGGPGPSEITDTNPINKLRKLIEPQVDGLYTIYDGDSIIMTQYQESIPEEERVDPIESNFNISIISDMHITAEVSESERDQNTDINRVILKDMTNSSKADGLKITNRTDVLKKRKDVALMNEGEETSTKKRKTANECFRLLAEEKIELVRLQKDVLKMEEGFKIEMHELELKLKMKELELLELKIKKESL